MNRKLRLLIVEDEEAILKGLIDLFIYHGYEVASATDGLNGLEMALSQRFDLVILDIMLPEMDGYTVCNKIREATRELPIMMLTARTTEEDIINGLTLGADDYMAKPFSIRELVLRVQAILRRSQRLAAEEEIIHLGEQVLINTLDLTGQWLLRNADKSAREEGIVFTRREVEIIRYLKRSSPRAVSREELLDKIWDYSRASEIETRTVDIHIAKLRRKIELSPKEPVFLLTIRGEGYKLVGAH